MRAESVWGKVLLACVAAVVCLFWLGCRERVNEIAGPPTSSPTPRPVLSPNPGVVPTPTPSPTPAPTPDTGPTSSPQPTSTPNPAKPAEGTWQGQITDTNVYGCDALSKALRLEITQNGASLSITAYSQHNGIDPLKTGTSFPGTFDANLKTIKVAVDDPAIRHDAELETKIHLDGLLIGNQIRGTHTTEICNWKTGICFCRQSGEFTVTWQ